MPRPESIIAVAVGCLALAYALPNTARQVQDNTGRLEVEGHYVSRPIFQDKLQFDVVTVLLLLGEATIWKSVWTRFRFRRSSWKQWIFAIAPGWAPLSGTIFAALQGSRGPPNLVYDRAPDEVVYQNLALTNLNSGASHIAKNVILQNVFQAWYNGPRKDNRTALVHGQFYTTKEVGIVDVDVSKMESPTNWTLWVQTSCLVVQMTLALVLGLLGLSLEVFITFAVTLVAQGLLLAAITPRHSAWDHRDLTIHKTAPVMLHMGMDSTSILFVRCAMKDGKTFSLEEYSWESQTIRSSRDTIQLLLAGVSFCAFAFQLILISWMSTNSRILFLALGACGLFTNAFESAVEPDWIRVYQRSFEGEAFCEPAGSSLIAAIGVIIGGKFGAGTIAAKLLYPDNKRFAETLDLLTKIIQPNICDSCACKIRSRTDEKCLKPDGMLCCTRLAQKMVDEEVSSLPSKKTVQDALATLIHFLRLGTEEEKLPKINTDPNAPIENYNWNKKS